MSALHAVFALALAAGLPEQQDPGSEPPARVAAAHAEWGALAAMAGADWARPENPDQVFRVLWRELGRELVWQYRSPGADWADTIVYTKDAATGEISGAMPALGNRRGVVELDPNGSATLVFGGLLPSRTRYAVSGDEIEISQSGRMIPTSTTRMARVAGSGAALPSPPTTPRAPIVISAGDNPAPATRAVTGARPARPRPGPVPTPAPAPPLSSSGSRPGPIVIALAPPPPAPVRAAPRSGPRTETPRLASPNSREAQMLAQVETRRIAAAQEAELERQRQAQIAEQARQAEESRRAQEAANSAAWSEGLGFLAALAGGVAAGMQTGGDMASISGGMAVGASLVAPNSEVAAATNQNFQAEYQRFEEQRAHEAAVIAAMNDPNNPLTQEARRRDEARETRAQAETARIETESRERREEADREALMQERAAAARQDEADGQARQEQAEADQQRREQQARRAAEQREREAQQTREEQERRDEEARQRREQAEREADARRQEQERQRAAAEAERNRVIDFREAVVLCSLTGPQAQFNNWRCEGPLQMTYVNFEQANVPFHFDQMSCASYRELPRAGPYRAFGCGYGLHPTNPGASRNVPEMLGVFVDGRVTFRCPRNISGVCRDR